MPAPAYGRRHQVKRDAAMALLVDGSPCEVCGLGRYRDRERNPDGRSLHLDHVVSVAEGGQNGPTRLVHARCNESRGGRQGAAITNARKKGFLWSPQAPQATVKGTYDRW